MKNSETGVKKYLSLGEADKIKERLFFLLK